MSTCPADKFRSPPNHPAVERLVETLYAVQDACLALFEAHGDECECDYCDDAEWIGHTMRVALPLYESNLLPFPAMNERWEKRLREHSAKQAPAIVEATTNGTPAAMPSLAETRPATTAAKAPQNPFYKAMRP
jgi:hypothetical protein